MFFSEPHCLAVVQQFLTRCLSYVLQCFCCHAMKALTTSTNMFTYTVPSAHSFQGVTFLVAVEQYVRSSDAHLP